MLSREAEKQALKKKQGVLVKGEGVLVPRASAFIGINFLYGLRSCAVVMQCS